ncbi:MAG: hypothetical protein AAGU23_06615 [Bacillota bacterium]
MTLDEAIDFITLVRNMCVLYNTTPRNYQTIVNLLCELRDRRETELRPATRFLGNTIPQQLRHIQSELEEAETEIINYWRFDKFNQEKVESARLRAGEELEDLKAACTTMQVILGFDENGRRSLARKVIAKNQARGYYEEADPA